MFEGLSRDDINMYFSKCLCLHSNGKVFYIKEISVNKSGGFSCFKGNFLTDKDGGLRSNLGELIGFESTVSTKVSNLDLSIPRVGYVKDRYSGRVFYLSRRNERSYKKALCKSCLYADDPMRGQEYVDSTTLISSFHPEYVSLKFATEYDGPSILSKNFAAFKTDSGNTVIAYRKHLVGSVKDGAIVLPEKLKFLSGCINKEVEGGRAVFV